MIDVVPSQIDPVLAAADRAPLVELTDRERAVLDEAESRPVQWITHAGLYTTE